MRQNELNGRESTAGNLGYGNWVSTAANIRTKQDMTGNKGTHKKTGKDKLRAKWATQYSRWISLDL